MITISEEGLAFLKEREGFHPTPVLNFKGDLVIGYGHPAEEGRTRVTEDEACRLLDDDLKMPIKQVRQSMQFVQLHSFFGKRIPQPKEDSLARRPDYHWLRSFVMIQNRYDALLSILFTMTYPELKATDMMRAIYDGAPDDEIEHQMKRLVYIPDPLDPSHRIKSDYLIDRRQHEADLFFHT